MGPTLTNEVQILTQRMLNEKTSWSKDSDELHKRAEDRVASGEMTPDEAFDCFDLEMSKMELIHLRTLLYVEVQKAKEKRLTRKR